MTLLCCVMVECDVADPWFSEVVSVFLVFDGLFDLLFRKLNNVNFRSFLSHDLPSNRALDAILNNCQHK